MGLSIIATFLAAATPSPTTPAPTTFSLDMAIDRALTRSPQIFAAAAATDAARARVDMAGSAWLPRVVVDAHYRYQGPVPELELTVPNTPIVVRRDLGSEHAADAFVTVGWRALDFGPRVAREEASAALVRASAADHATRTVEIAFATRVAYLSLWLAIEARRATEHALMVAGTARADAEKRRAGGVGNAVAVAAADARQAELEARLGDATKGVARARASLEALVGPLDDPYIEAIAAWAGPATIPAPPAGDDTEHPALARTHAAEAALRAQERAASGGRWPTLDLFARFGVQYPATLVDSDKAGLAWAAGVTFTWEVFDGGRADDEAAALGAQAREVAHQRDALQDELTRQRADALAQLVAAGSALAAGERRVAAAKVYLEAARGASTAGVVLDTERLNAEANLDSAELALLQARFDGAIAEAQALRALGIVRQELRP